MTLSRLGSLAKCTRLHTTWNSCSASYTNEALPQKSIIQLVEYTPYSGRIRYEAGDRSGQPLDRAMAVRRIEALYEQVTRQLPVNGS